MEALPHASEEIHSSSTKQLLPRQQQDFKAKNRLWRLVSALFLVRRAQASASLSSLNIFQLFLSHLSSTNRERDGNQDKYICYQLRSGIWHGDGEFQQYWHVSEALPDSCRVFLDGCDYIYISWAGHRRRSRCFLWSHAPVPSPKIGSSSVERETKWMRAESFSKKSFNRWRPAHSNTLTNDSSLY